MYKVPDVVRVKTRLIGSPTGTVTGSGFVTPKRLPVTLAVIVRGAAVVVVVGGTSVVVVVGSGAVVEVVGPVPEGAAEAASKLRIAGATHTPPATAAPRPRARRRLTMPGPDTASVPSVDSIGSDMWRAPSGQSLGRQRESTKFSAVGRPFVPDGESRIGDQRTVQFAYWISTVNAVFAPGPVAVVWMVTVAEGAPAASSTKENDSEVMPV